MPADVFPDDVIDKMPEKIDSPAMLRALRRVQVEGVIQNDASLDKETFAHLQKLANLGLVDPGYSDGKPWNWISNHNGRRVLKRFDPIPSDDAAPDTSGEWLP
jgi:hypothetical protein